MNFWEIQKDARRRTFWLTTLYIFMVVLLSFTAAYAIDYAWFKFSAKPHNAYYPYPDEMRSYAIGAAFFITLLAIPTLIFFITVFSPISSDSGGKVAESLDGVLVAPQSTDVNERRLLNVVEEMALASGISVPPVYILKKEEGINAFAAGSRIDNAVIAVTRGALLYLSRDELEAVIAHEFSHILNKDVAINLQFAKLLFAFLFMGEIGRVILQGMGRSRGNRNSNGAGLVVLIALVCYVFGILTAFLGRIVQAGVNRQREFLADASAVQFMRSPALAEALKKIGGLAQGSRLTATNMAASYGHLFFGEASFGLFSTHPPLNNRILRIDPTWDGVFPDTSLLWENTFLEENAASTELPTPLANQKNCEQLRVACREPLDACYVVFALLLSNDPKVQAVQLSVSIAQKAERSIKAYKDLLDTLPRREYVPIIQLAMPALKNLSPKQYAALNSVMLKIIRANEAFPFKDWVLHQIIESQVGPQYKNAPAGEQSPPSDKQMSDAVVTLLAFLTSLDPKETNPGEAFALGLKSMNLPSEPLPPHKPYWENVGGALETLRLCPKLMRDNFLHAAVAVITHNKILSEDEDLLLRAAALCLNRAVPPEANAEVPFISSFLYPEIA